MEGSRRSSSAAGGGGVLCTAQEPREGQEEKGVRGASGGGGAMRARVCARVRTPLGIGAVLVVGGAIVGAAVVAWRRRGAWRRDDGKGAKNRHHREQPVKEEALDGGISEAQKGGALVPKFDLSDENLRGDNTKVGANGSHTNETICRVNQIQKVNEITVDELDGRPAEKFYHDSISKYTEIITVDMLQDSGNVNKADKNSSKCDIENESTQNDTETMENSEQNILSSIGSPEIAHEEHTNHDDGAQQTESTETTATTQTMMDQQQLSEEEEKMEAVTETTEAKMAERTIMETNVFEQEEAKAQAELVDLVGVPTDSTLSSLLKLAEKKKPGNPGWNETGMKLEQDIPNGELNGHELSKGGAAHSAAAVVMEQRTVSVSILALVLAVIIGIAIAMRLHAPLQAT